MPQVSCDSRLIDHRALTGFCTRLLMSAKFVKNDARLVADTLVEANLRGVDSHGAARLPHYLRRIRHGSINPQPQIKTEVLGPAAARVDGDHGLGQLVMHRATLAAIERAKNAGRAGCRCVIPASAERWPIMGCGLRRLA